MNDIFSTIFKNSESTNAENGFKCSVLFDPANNPEFIKAPCEQVFPDKNGNNTNTWIVFGRDRPGEMDSEFGYGPKGHSKSGMIDIVVGRLSGVDATTISGGVEPSIGADAARIYISQKADIDQYFKIKDGRTGSSIALSAIAIKADDVRLVARNSIKFVTHTDAFLSNGDRSLLASGVQLIANNEDSDMQPIPKGNNLENSMNGLLESILELNGMIQGLMEVQKDFNEALTTHTHKSPFFGLDTSPSPEAIVAGKEAFLQMYLRIEQGLKNNASNVAAFRNKFLVASSAEYINSAYHYLN